MSWIGLRYKVGETILPHEWNAVVDALDVLKQGVDYAVKIDDLPALPSDVGPAQDAQFYLGFRDRRWLEVNAVYGYIGEELYVKGRRVLKDGDPVYVYGFVGPAAAWAARVDRPATPYSFVLDVYQEPRPLAQPGTTAKRWHIKLPRASPYPVYLGSYESQDYVLEPGDSVTLEIYYGDRIYLRSLGPTRVHVLAEL